VASWGEVAGTAPELAERVRELFDAHKHKTMATIRRDGSPRISGIEATFENGQLWLGMMPSSRKTQDLRRDPRLALHSGSVEGGWTADAKVSGSAIEEPEGSHRFRIDVAEAVVTRLGDPPQYLVIEWWTEGRGLQRIHRS
jgi:hypothetical protein